MIGYIYPVVKKFKIKTVFNDKRKEMPIGFISFVLNVKRKIFDFLSLVQTLLQYIQPEQGFQKGLPLLPFVESGDVILLKALFAKSSARTGRFGNPIGRVSDGSFPYFCPYRNRVLARHERRKTLFFKKGKTDCRAPDGGADVHNQP
ncbi:MAG TPA: hypothetical protein DDY61_01580, partial [Ruminococcaceae bacterium]|nr:hypothetical protein [Oscillospiraceae bacterium]